MTPDREPAFSIVAMTVDDWPAVRRIYAERGSRPATRRWSARRPTGAISTARTARMPARRPRWIGRHGGPVVGWTALGGYSARKVYSGVAWESVYVAEDARGRGVGRALLEALIPASEAAGYWTLLAGVLAENAPSLALHERVGFRRIGVQHRLGQDARGRWRDVVLLERRSAVIGID